MIQMSKWSKQKLNQFKPSKYKARMTGSTIDYDVPEKITNADGNEIDNLADDVKKLTQTKLKMLFH